jgi:DNA-binding GntR family transcriptional regulator
MPRVPKAGARAYDRLRNEILDGTLAPGTVLYEVEQARRLGVSRTPIREALGRLLAEGLVTSTAARGLVVTALDVEDISKLFEVRAALEASAAQLAARQRDPAMFDDFAAAFRSAQAPLLDPTAAPEVVGEYYALIRRFDRAIDLAANNSYLVDALESLRTHVARVRGMAAASRQRLAASAEEHALIAEAIVDGDAVLAGNATHVHLHHSLQHFASAFAAAAHRDSA